MPKFYQRKLLLVKWHCLWNIWNCGSRIRKAVWVDCVEKALVGVSA